MPGGFRSMFARSCDPPLRVGSRSMCTPCVGLLAQADVDEGLGRAHARDGAQLVADEREEMVVVLAHDFIGGVLFIMSMTWICHRHRAQRSHAARLSVD